jgi:hypothetical protein
LFSLHKIIVSLFFISLFSSLIGGNPYLSSAGAGEAGMGSVCVMKTGFWPSFSNQSLLANNTSILAGFNYENRFNLWELGTRTAGLIIPAGRTSLGLTYSHFGYSDFRRSMAGLACGMPLGENISGGIQIDYFFEKTTGDYDNYQSVSFEAGLYFKPSEKVSIGIHVFNPVPNSLRKTNMPSSIRAGAGIELSKVLFAGAEAEMSTGEKLIVRTGFEYEVFKKLFLRGGFSSENTSFTFGMGYILKSIKIDLSFVTHERLGITSSASLIFKIK